MGPVEVLFITIGVIVTLIGLARGYAKELGNTTIILVAIFVLTFFEDTIVRVLKAVVVRVPGLLTNPSDVQAESLLLSAIFTIAFVTIVFASYAGRTLDMGGKPAKPPVGTMYTALIAILNVDAHVVLRLERGQNLRGDKALIEARHTDHDRGAALSADHGVAAWQRYWENHRGDQDNEQQRFYSRTVLGHN